MAPNPPESPALYDVSTEQLRQQTKEYLAPSPLSYADAKNGVMLMKDPVIFRGISTPVTIRATLGIRGLIPAGHIPLEVDIERCVNQLRSLSTPLEKYLYLQNIQDVNERLYYGILVAHTHETMPIVYTPTVGEACEKFSSIYRGTLRGLYLSLEDLGRVGEILNNWPTSNVTTIVVTDGERILGLGDQGVNGMGIPIGKLALYTACAGIDPAAVLPVHLDTGTDNEKKLADPFYLGLRRRRERGPDYDVLVEEFFDACQAKFGRNVLIQFEDFGNRNAFRLLDKFKDRATTFNDDIQGTASVALAGLLASRKITGKTLSEHTYLFAGAGEAGTGIADLIAYAISIESNIDVAAARKKIFLVDSRGLVTKQRMSTLQHHKIKYAHDVDFSSTDILSAVHQIQPSVLVGVSAVPKTFTKAVCQKMAEINNRPIIFALSNPTSKAECTAIEAYEWTDGKAVFASGSPFDPVTLDDGRHFVPGQGNNAYIFPGLGLGALAAGSTKMTDHDMYIAAKVLAEQVSPRDTEVGCLYPPLSSIREVSTKIAEAIALRAHESKVATKPKPYDMYAYVKSIMYNPMED